ncbi:MAG: DMT family transporter [Nevskia sp.]
MTLRAGILYAVLACVGWGFAFVGPLILGDWPGLAVAAGRYIAYGLGSLATLALLARRGRARLREPRLWRDATLLTLSGNLLYYAFLSISVQKAGYVMPTLIIGLLPVTVSLFGRLRMRSPVTARYAWALLLILGGLWLAHAPRAVADEVATTDDYAIGIACAFAALALWTIYGVINTERLKAHPGIGGLQWSSLQGAASLPFALMLFAATPSLPHSGADWSLFVAISLVLGLLTSWVANAFWNMASTVLPPSLLGQMIVFETIAGIAYGAVWSQAPPPATVLAGTAVLIAGVVVAISERAPAAETLTA